MYDGLKQVLIINIEISADRPLVVVFGEIIDTAIQASPEIIIGMTVLFFLPILEMNSLLVTLACEHSPVT